MSKSTRRLFVIPDDHYAAYKREAKRQGVSVARYLIESADANLPADEQKKLSELRDRGRPTETDQ